jgi:hypothetical protein
MGDISLFEIANSIKLFEEKLAQNAGEISEQDDALIEQIKSDLQTKTTNVKAWLYKLEGDIETLQAIARKYNAEAERVSSKLEKFQAYIIDCMDRMESVEIGGADKIKIRKPSQVLEIINEDDLPIEFFESKTVTTTRVLKEEIKKAIKAGKDIPGAKLSFGKRSLIY